MVVRTLRVTEVYIRHVRLLSASEESERWTNVTGIGGFNSTRQRQETSQIHNTPPQLPGQTQYSSSSRPNYFVFMQGNNNRPIIVVYRVLQINMAMLISPVKSTFHRRILLPRDAMLARYI